MPITEPRRYCWTQEEYYRVTNLEWFFEKRVQLIEGEIIEFPAYTNWHAAGQTLTKEALELAFGKGYWVRNRSPLDLGPLSLPEPDLAVILGDPRSAAREHPRTALLVVEVSDNTLDFDRTRKAALYAKSALPECWILNLIDRCLERLVVLRHAGR